MKVEVVRAWPRHHVSRVLELAEGATVADALLASGIDDTDAAGYAVFGERTEPDRRLREGDRVEVLGPLLADPKEARRKRAGSKPAGR
jgi:putative ubiquitin-RnfH superfamily antitoxin RatB of RatAB toxin-antitoxin module